MTEVYKPPTNLRDTPIGFIGVGQHFTLSDPDRYTEMTAYQTITWNEIVGGLADPQHCDKEQAWWVIPSASCARQARRKRYQTEHGQYWIFVADVDEGNKSLAEVKAALALVLDPGTEYVIYASKSSTPLDQRWKALVLIGRAVPGDMFTHAARGFNVALARALGVKLDGSTEHLTQYQYLPNRGLHYEYWHQPGEPWGFTDDLIKAEALSQMAHSFAAQATGGRTERANPNRPYFERFEREYPVAYMLERCGFETNDGVNWHYTGQSTGSYATKITDEGGWVTSSGTVADITGRRGGDSFDLFVGFEWGGDREGATKAWVKEVHDRRTRLLEEVDFSKITVNGEPLRFGVISH